MNLKAGFKQTDWMRKEYVPFRKHHEQNVSRREDGGGEGKNENHSLGGSGVMEGGEAGGEQVCVLARLWRAGNTSQSILGCVCQAGGGLEGV